jgi:CHASE2 domain-containing sensor protein
MKRNIITGTSLGAIAGIIDVIPMVIQRLTWDANISAFLMWVVIGFILSITELKMNSILKGILISYLVLLPSAILIGWKEPVPLVPILIMTTILGGALGYSFHRFKN